MANFQYCLFCGSPVYNFELTNSTQKQAKSIMRSIPLLLNLHPANDSINWEIELPKSTLCSSCYKAAVEGHDLIMSLNKIQKELNRISIQIKNIILTKDNVSHVYAPDSENASRDHDRVVAKLKQHLANCVNGKYSSSINKPISVEDIVTDDSSLQGTSYLPQPIEPIMTDNDDEDDNQTRLESLPDVEATENGVLPVVSDVNNENSISADDNNSNGNVDTERIEPFASPRPPLPHKQWTSEGNSECNDIRRYDPNPRVLEQSSASHSSNTNDFFLDTAKETFHLKHCTVRLVRFDDKLRELSNANARKQVSSLRKASKRMVTIFLKSRQDGIHPEGKDNPNHGRTECRVVFPTPLDWNRHVLHSNHKILQPNPKRLHICPVTECSQQFFTTVFLERHIREHHNIQYAHFCNLGSCTKGFYTLVGLQVHQEGNHGKSTKKFQCDPCPSTHKEPRTGLGTEIEHKTTNRQPYYDCAECSERFPSLLLHRRHMVQAHPALRCPITECTQHFGTTWLLERHIRDEHDTEFAHFCNLDSCVKRFYTLLGLQAHQEKNHDESKKKFQCDSCFVRFLRKASLLNHKKCRHDTVSEYKFLCDKCTFGCHFKTYLENHQAKEHNQFMRRHKCPKCDFGSGLRGALKKHIAGHLEPGKNSLRKYACSQDGCTSRFDLASQLAAHIRGVHKTERNFQCDQCPVTFKNYASLQYHLKIHAGLKNFTCPHCSKTLVGERNLQDHIRVLHEPEHAHSIKCEDCGAGFPIRKYYRRHRKICAQGYPGTAKKTTPKMIEARRRRTK